MKKNPNKYPKGFLVISGYAKRPQVDRSAAEKRDVVEEVMNERAGKAEFRVGMMIIGVGVALLLMCGKSNAEKNGYKF